MAPIPSAVSDHGPSDFVSRWSGCSESEISLSMDFLAKSWLARSASLKQYVALRLQRKDVARRVWLATSLPESA